MALLLAEISAEPWPKRIMKSTMLTKEDAHQRLHSIRLRMDKACAVARRPPGDAALVAVSKTFEAADIRPFLEAGQRVFGENRVQEAKTKWPAQRVGFADIGMHLFGPLHNNQ